MGNVPSDKSEDNPALGRPLVWFVNPKNSKTIVRVLIAICVLLFLADFTYHKHGHFAIEDYKGFYGFYGFVMFTALILTAKLLRFFIQRPEDYYGDSTIDDEGYPPEQLEKAEHGDV